MTDAASMRFPMVAVAPVAVRKATAAEMLGVSVDFFEAEVQPELRLIRRGRLVLVPVRELERWADRNAALTIEERR